MTTFKVFRETALPGTLDPYAVYFVAPPAKPDFCEVYVSNSAGTGVKRLLNETDIQALIDASVVSANNIQVVDDITARNALSPTENTIVVVIDASADVTVTAGSATYLYRFSTTTWIKLAEYESMDLSLSWASIQNKPTSSVADIDDAVTKRHIHANKTQLDKVGENVSGLFTYNSLLPVIAWSSVVW